MNKTIEEAAIEHALNAADAVILNGEMETNYVERARFSFIVGANFALSHQWRSVEEELPEDDTLAVVHSPNGRVEVLHYYDDAFQDELKQAHCVDYWMALPEIPSLNPEQR